MKKNIRLWQLGGFFFTAVAGTLLHFLFDWTGQNSVAALFSAVNESIWEHMKLLFYPLLVVAVLEYRAWGKDYPQFWCIKVSGILLGLVLIPVLYYTYTGVLGQSADWFNITIFFLVAGLVFGLETRWLQEGKSCDLSQATALALVVVLIVLFTGWTVSPPRLPLFQDPQTGTYGFPPTR